MKNRKAKGAQGERELVKLFNESGWSCVRIAGSGSSQYPAPDILAGNAMRRFAIECKVTKEQKKYFHHEEIEQLKEFSRKFGAEALIGVRFSGEQWYFFTVDELERTGNCWAVSREYAKMKGMTTEELLKMSDKNRKI
jgi:Holliday junction resolvase